MRVSKPGVPPEGQLCQCNIQWNGMGILHHCRTNRRSILGLEHRRRQRNLFKAGDNFGGGPPGGGGNNTAADLAYYGDDPTTYADRYELKTNEDLNDWSDLISFIDFVNNNDLAAFEGGIEYRLDVDGFLRSAALDSFFAAFGQLHRFSAQLLPLPQPRFEPVGMDQV